MAFSRPSLTDLITRIEADLISRLQITTTVLRRAFVRILARVFGGAVHGLHGHVEWASKQILVSTADEDYLDLHGSDYQVPRKVATFALGNVTFTGNNGVAIPVGTRLLRSDDVEYQTTTSGVIASGTLTLAVIALSPGATGNASAGVSLSLVSSIASVNSTCTVAAGGIANGLDAEKDDDYRERILTRKRNPSHGGSRNDYINWALEVPGVTRAWAYSNYGGINHVGVTFVMDDLPNIIPVGSKVTEVQNYLNDDSRRPICTLIDVFAPTSVPFSPTISVIPNTPEVRAAVTAEIQDLLFRVGEPSATLTLSEINEAISAAAGETSHTLVSPVANVTYTATQIPTMGTITFT